MNGLKIMKNLSTSKIYELGQHALFQVSVKFSTFSFIHSFPYDLKLKPKFIVAALFCGSNEFFMSLTRNFDAFDFIKVNLITKRDII